MFIRLYLAFIFSVLLYPAHGAVLSTDEASKSLGV